MRQVDFLVEEPSAEAALRNILPELLRGRAAHKIINFGSKYKLVKRLPERLAAYKSRIAAGEDLKLLILVDRDSDNCLALKRTLEEACRRVGLCTKSSTAADGSFSVVNRIVVEELEAWFLGDPEALRAAYSSLPPISVKSNLFRNPDNGGTWEALHRYLKKHGIYKSAYPKIDAARKISACMDLTRNTSSSFRCFCNGVNAALV